MAEKSTFSLRSSVTVKFANLYLPYWTARRHAILANVVNLYIYQHARLTQASNVYIPTVFLRLHQHNQKGALSLKTPIFTVAYPAIASVIKGSKLESVSEEYALGSSKNRFFLQAAKSCGRARLQGKHGEKKWREIIFKEVHFKS